jgi:hypothetical protein
MQMRYQLEMPRVIQFHQVHLPVRLTHLQNKRSTINFDNNINVHHLELLNFKLPIFCADQ